MLIDVPNLQDSTPHPQDRRGLSEIVAWSVMTVVLGTMNLAFMVLSTRNGGQLKVNEWMLGALGGLITILVARGTQGANERSGSSQALNIAANTLNQIAASVVQQHKQTAFTVPLPAVAPVAPQAPPPTPTTAPSLPIIPDEVTHVEGVKP